MTILTIKELGDICNINVGVMRQYLSHYTLTKYLVYQKKGYKSSLAVEITDDFLADFEKYLKLKKRDLPLMLSIIKRGENG